MTWNIRCRTKRLDEVADVAAESGADIVVLTEYREGKTGDLSRELVERGFTFTVTSPADSANTDVRRVLIGSTTPLGQLEGSAPPLYPERWAGAVVQEIGLVIGGVYLPGSRTGAKQQWWTWLLSEAARLGRRPALLIGDFNTGLHRIDEQGATFSCAASMQELMDSGWTDAWRSLHPQDREFTWWSHVGNGFRLDHAFVNGRVRVERAEFLQTLGDHTLVRSPDSADDAKGLSDHAALITTCTVV